MISGISNLTRERAGRGRPTECNVPTKVRITFSRLWLLLIITLPLAGAVQSPAIYPAAPNLSPGPEYADNVRMFQGIPGIERASNGRLWATWYGGGVAEDANNYVLLYTSGDNGVSWERVLVLDPDSAGPDRAFDPCLWHDPTGKLWLFWAQGGLFKRDATGAHRTFAITTTDSGNAAARWSSPREIARGVMMNKPTASTDGRWLLPVATWYEDGSAGVVVSADRGGTFVKLGAANIADAKQRDGDEHMVVERKNGTLWMLVRGKFGSTGSVSAGIGESVSTDKGKNWSAVARSSIPHPVSRFFIRRLASGRLLMVRHNPPNAGNTRSHLTAFLSEDEGRSWLGGLLLDERNGVSYPDGVQAPNGSCYVIYDFQRIRDKEILMAVFSETDVLAGKISSPNSRLRAQINQATGANPSVRPAPK